MKKIKKFEVNKNYLLTSMTGSNGIKVKCIYINNSFAYFISDCKNYQIKSNIKTLNKIQYISIGNFLNPQVIYSDSEF